jgi:methyl-accepting chemotaxis protein
MKLGNLKIGMRLGVGFGVVLLLVAIVAFVGVNRLMEVDNTVRSMIQGPFKKQDTAAELLMEVKVDLGNSMAMLNAINDEDYEHYKKLTESQAKVVADLRDAIQAALSKDAEELALWDVLMQERDHYGAARMAMLSLKENAYTIVDRERIYNELIPAAEAYTKSMSDLVAFYVRDVERSQRYIQDVYKTGFGILLGCAAAAILLGVFIAWFLTTSITRPLQGALKLAERVASGDLASKNNIEAGQDEVGQLLAALYRMQDNLTQTVAKIRQGANAIRAASTEIATGNLDLSSRTEQQASSLEETASSIEELTSTVRQNADNAAQANRLAMSAREVAEQGGAVAAQVADKMTAITTSSRKIADIITVIDGIAFQTNILALNAAVEAARAGEQGRGFAVVATEVRSLAQRSASAAKEIKDLIAESVSNVEQGETLVDLAGKNMRDIVAGIRQVNDIVAEIAAASLEQSEGIAQVNLAITQMDQVTQQNAALVEEAAAASDAMQDQSRTLVDSVGVFKVAEGFDSGFSLAPTASPVRTVPKLLA